MQTQLKTFEECLAQSGTEKEKAFFSNPQLVSALELDELAYKMLKVCARNWNTDATTGKVWEPDWSNHNQYKYFPWMQVKASEQNPAGFGFSRSGYDDVGSYTGVGSRLCFAEAKTAIEFGKTFADMYKDYWLIPQQ